MIAIVNVLKYRYNLKPAPKLARIRNSTFFANCNTAQLLFFFMFMPKLSDQSHYPRSPLSTVDLPYLSSWKTESTGTPGTSHMTTATCQCTHGETRA